MNFINDKNVCLSKIDKSKKGSIDVQILELVDAINRSSHYYTTSSCSGRIVLQTMPESGRKNESEWLYVSHNLVTNTDCIMFEINGSKEELWFRMEAAILHVACDSLENAQKLVDFARNNGFRRAGVQATNKKFIVEIIGSERIDAPVAVNREALVDELYLSILVDKANWLLKRNWNKIAALLDFFR